MDGRIAGASRLKIGRSDMRQASKKGSGSQHHCPRGKSYPQLGHHTGDTFAFKRKIIHRLLE